VDGDFDGDGTADLYVISDQSSWFCPGPQLAMGTGCVQTGPGYGWKSSFNISAFDENGDGFDDLHLENAASTWVCRGPAAASAALACQQLP
jgi:hypothetical protein